MCHHCDKQVSEMDIRDSDLPNLPYKLVKWKCIVKNCNRFTRMKDYGIDPLYHWGKKKNKWISVMLHFFLCPKHWPIYNRRHIPGVEDPLIPMPKTIEEIQQTIIPIIKSKMFKNGKSSSIS